MRVVPDVTLKYIGACELGSAVSISFVWIESEGGRTPAVEIHMDGGSGPDLVRRLGLTVDGHMRGVEINQVLEFASGVTRGARKMLAEMLEEADNAVEAEADES